MIMKKDAVMFMTGGVVYPVIELMWRGYSHYSMMIAGGLSLYLINKLCCKKLREKRMYMKCLAGSGIITGVEFFTGIVFNKIFMMNVWDYSALPYNIGGQICLPFSVIWFFLTIPAVFICDKLSNIIDSRKSSALPQATEAEA